MTFSNMARPAHRLSGSGPQEEDHAGNRERLLDTKASRSHQALTTVATIEKSPSAQLCVGISSWRGSHKLDMREATATIPGFYMPTSAGVSIDIAEALRLAKEEAISRSLIPRTAS